MSEKKRFAVESLSIFAEVHVVYAKDEEEAKKIAAEADSNTSNWLGQKVIRVRDCGKKQIQRYKQEDKYFFNSASMIDEEGYLIYTDLDGKVVNESMDRRKVGDL